LKARVDGGVMLQFHNIRFLRMDGVLYSSFTITNLRNSRVLDEKMST